ncbi:MAG: glycosyltransferase [Acidobacteria bacterium]|nr:glycosyltransferase [Acidobacteriota bacterium]
MISRIKKALRIVRREGISAGYSAFLRQIDKGRRDREYRDWTERYDTLDDAGRERLRAVAAELENGPLISVLMPVYNVEERFLREAIGSVRAQIYQNWELCIADDASTEPHVRRVLEELSAADARIRVTFREMNGHISAASNTALEMVRGEFTALMDHDDILAEDALLQAARVITSRPEVNLIYSDEDKIDANGVRFQPMFKPDWSPELMRSLNLITHLCVFRTEVMRAIGGFRTGFEGSQDYDLSLRFIDSISPETIVHIPHVLYHWRAIPGSVALDSGEKTYAHERARTALTEHYRRSGIAARAVRGLGELHRPEFLGEPPRVSLILWGDGSSDIDHGSVHEVREASGDVASIVREANETSGDVLVFLHRDNGELSANFFAELAHRAAISGVGAVGPKLLDPDRRIANAGFVFGIMNGIGRPHFGMRRDDFGPFVGLAADRNVLALSLAAMAVSRKVFDEAGGLDESFGDPVTSGIDLCLRLHAAGKRNVWTPWAEATSGTASLGVSEEGIARLRERWKKYFDRDPYYNPKLTAEGEDLRFAEPPRAERW